MKTSSIQLIQGDITMLSVDTIVNAANASLLGGAGVDGAIHRAGGPSILEECRMIVAKQGGCKTGEAVITHGGNLPATFVIHTVGPVWDGGKNNEAEHLTSCYKNSLKLAIQHKCRTVAFPNISTGVYGFPKDLAARIAMVTVSNFLSDQVGIEKVVFVCFDHENYLHMNKLMKLKEQNIGKLGSDIKW